MILGKIQQHKLVTHFRAEISFDGPVDQIPINANKDDIRPNDTLKVTGTVLEKLIRPYLETISPISKLAGIGLVSKYTAANPYAAETARPASDRSREGVRLARPSQEISGAISICLKQLSTSCSPLRRRSHQCRRRRSHQYRRRRSHQCRPFSSHQCRPLSSHHFRPLSSHHFRPLSSHHFASSAANRSRQIYALLFERSAATGEQIRQIRSFARDLGIHGVLLE